MRMRVVACLRMWVSVGWGLEWLRVCVGTFVRACPAAACVRAQDALLLGRGSAFIGCFASCYARMAFNLMVAHKQYAPARPWTGRADHFAHGACWR